jgi:UPF0755 protein
MKKLLLGLLLVLILAAAVGAWIFMGSGTGFSGAKQTLYIRSDGATRGAVLDSLRERNLVRNQAAFEFLASRMGYWSNIRPGRYEFERGTSLLSIVRRLRNGQQTPVNLVITKLRTKEDFARMTGNRFEFDSAAMIRFLNNGDSLSAYGVDSSTAMTQVMPDTYTFFWNTTPAAVYDKLAKNAARFWTEARKQKAAAKGLTPTQAVVLASIVEEETTNNAEKGNVASVYLNRLQKGMPLQADPTIKFAMRNFGLRRIYEKYLFVASPYNTYRNRGLPPGPICTPSTKSINAVLDAPSTDYLYFVADPTRRETHDFSTTYEEHLRKARLYQQALNRRDSVRKSEGR